MALPIKRRPNPELDKLNTEYSQVRTGYDAAASRVNELSGARDRIGGVVKPQTIVPRGESFRPTEQISSTPGGMSAMREVDSQLAGAKQERDTLIKPLQSAAAGFRGYADRTNASTLLRGAGVTPAARPVAQAAIASPASALSPIGTASAAPAGVSPAAAGPKVNIIDPRNPASMQVLPPGRSPTTPAAASQPPASTYRKADGSTGQLPPGVAVSYTKAGTPAFGATGSSVAAAEKAGGLAPASQRPVVMPYVQGPARRPQYGGGGQVASIGIPGEDLRRRDIALSSATVRTARSRGERAQQAQAVQAINDDFAQRQGIDATAVNAQLEANTRQAIAGQDRDAQAIEGQADRENRLQEIGMRNASDERAALTARRPQVQVTEGGGIGLIGDDGSFTPVTGADGQQVRGARQRTDGVSPDTEYKALAEQMAEMQQSVPAKGEEQARADQVAGIEARMAQLTGNVGPGETAAGQGGAPPVEGARKAPDGKWYVANPDGSYSVVNP